MKTVLIGATALLASAGCLGSAQAQTAYTNAVLNGCYAHSSTSVDNDSGVAKDVVGTFCFDGNGNIVGTSGTPGASGSVGNLNGVVNSTSDQTGTYSVTNTPGDGMGTFQISCATHAFSVTHVNSAGVAQGFRFILIKKSKKCSGKGPDVIGGSGEYQGPLN